MAKMEDTEMLLRTNSVLCKILMRLPMWLPYRILSVRVGADCLSFVKIVVR